MFPGGFIHSPWVWVLLAATPTNAGIKVGFALHRPSTAQFFFNYDDGDAVVDRLLSYGAQNDVALLADFDGDTISDLALYCHGTWFINLFNGGVVDNVIFF